MRFEFARPVPLVGGCESIRGFFGVGHRGVTEFSSELVEEFLGTVGVESGSFSDESPSTEELLIGDEVEEFALVIGLDSVPGFHVDLTFGG